MPERAAFWPRTGTLIIADLHLGKANTLAAGLGAAVPESVLRGVVREDLARLARALERSKAQRVVVVGDLLHAPIGATPELIDEVAAWRELHPEPWVVVRGNHDAKIHRVTDAWRLSLVGDGLDEPPFRFVHIPPTARETSERGPYLICGHEHPAVTLGRSNHDGRSRDQGTLIKLPAFLVGAQRLILPAMSRFTAGGSIRTTPGDRFYACSPGEVFEVPAHGLATR